MGMRHSVSRRPAIIVGEQPGGDMTKGHNDAAGQRCQIDHGARLFRQRIGQRVGQDQPAFRVRVDDFDRCAIVHAQHVAGPVAARPHCVFGQRQNGDGGPCGAAAGEGEHRPGAGGGTGHVGAHVPHAIGRLDGNAASVEGHALADEGHRHAAIATPTQNGQ
jgi:hypothetical protein